MARKQALRRSESVHRSLFEYLPDAMLVSDTKGRIVRMNSQAEALFGYSRKELIGQSIDLLVPDGCGESHAARRASYHAAPQIRPMGVGKDLHARRKDGREVAVDISLSHATQDGELVVIAIVRDLSQHKRLEVALRESQRTLSTLMSNLPGMAYRCKNDRDRTLVFSSDGCSELTGYTAADFVQNRVVSFDELIHLDDRDKVWEDVQSAVREKKPFQLSYRITTATGNEKWVWEQGRGIFSSDGNVEAIEGFITDITARKQAEVALLARNQELHWLHEISQEILASQHLKTMPQIILDKALLISSCDLGIIRLLNKTTELLEPVASRGYKAPETPNQHRKLVENGTTDSLVQAIKLKQTVVWERLQDKPGLQKFKNEGIQSLITVPLRTDDHVFGILQLGSRTVRTFQPNLIHLLETLGYNLGIAVQMNNLLDDALANQTQLRILARKLVEAQETERRHIALELHDEVGQELTALKLFLGLAARSETGHEESRLDDAAELIDDLMAKVRNFSLRFRPAMLDDLGLLPTLLWHFKKFTAQTNIQVNFQHTLDMRFSTELETTAYRIVQESLTNAARHAKVNEISVRISANRQFIRIEIEDHGAGFDLTTTTHETAGLTGMRERAASTGGHLTVLSAAGAGTLVTAELPLEG